MMDLEHLRKLSKKVSDGPDPALGPKFKLGDEATAVWSFSWHIPEADALEYKKDLNVGLYGRHRWLCRP